MILIGDENIEYETIVNISCIEDIKDTPSNSIVLFDFDFKILKYTQQNDIRSAVVVNDIQEVIYASNLDAFYILPIQDILIQTQKIANNYMFDSKIIATIQSSDEIVDMALKEIDGVIYKSKI